ncbi:MAG: peptide chain release factor N(5)-glutamine methyltransferase [Clostridia bacterium]|nr:peptide chain release factor N(5)-glutamine methyltransferase [Clostridia bacterium]
MKLSEVCAAGLDALKRGGVEDASFDCSCLFSDVFGMKRAELFLHDGEAPREKTDEFIEKIDMRVHGRPLQYILGKWDFYDMTFFVGEGVLIPRPETETLVDIALSFIGERKGLRIFDLCTGSGCIGLTLAKKCPDCSFTLIDISPTALSFAEKNRSEYGLENVSIAAYDIRDGFEETFFSDRPDVILSNPPYVPSGEIASLQKEVRCEPSLALDGGESGLGYYHVIADKWLPYLGKYGFAAVECGEGQAERISALFSPFGETCVVRDAFGAYRFVTVNAS